jgi:hypothetical protein
MKLMMIHIVAFIPKQNTPVHKQRDTFFAFCFVTTSSLPRRRVDGFFIIGSTSSTQSRTSSAALQYEIPYVTKKECKQPNGRRFTASGVASTYESASKE